MKRKTIIIVLLLSYLTISAYAQQEKVVFTYVGNAGFLIKIGDKKILIDALFKGLAGDYILPEQIQEKLTLAQAPFDNVDLIIVTHAHGDHVDPSMVTEHMKNNPKAIFASTKQTVDALNALDTLDHFQERRIGFSPSKEKSDKKDIKGISIETFYLPHGPDSRIINIGFLISVNEITIFHTGDVDFDQFTFEEFRSLQLPEKKIDISFIQHFYLTSDSTSSQFVTKGIGGKYIIPIHYHFTTPSFDAAIVKENYPDAILFDKELESWKMPTKNDELPTLTGYYFNQPPPGDSSVVFAPGIISTDSTIEHGSPTFSPDGNEVFWQTNYRQSGKETQIFTMTMRRKNNIWTASEISPYGDGPVFSPDGKRLYFNSKEEKGTISYIEKEGNKWSDPKNLGLIARFPDLKFVYNLSLTDNGTLYFLGYAEELVTMNKYGIYRSELIDGVYAKPELLPSNINTEEGLLNWTPFIAPDESYLLFSSSRHTSENDYGDIYISFRNAEGSWTDPVKLSNGVNSDRQERFPAISPDGKYLFFTRWIARGNEDIMWVSSKIINDFKKEVLKPINQKK